LLFVGDDWAEDHHDVEVQDQSGRRLAKARLPEGIAGIARLHALIGEHGDPDGGPERVVIGIETDRGPWVAGLVAAGYRVVAVNPKRAAGQRGQQSLSGAKSDAADAHMLADLVRTHGHQLRPVAADSAAVAGIKVVARAHQTLIWDRTRQVLRLRQALREYFPAALETYAQLDRHAGLHAGDALELLGKAATPEQAARLSLAQIRAALRRAGRRGDLDARAAALQTVLRSPHLTQPEVATSAYAATVRSLVAVIITLNSEISRLETEVGQCFSRHPDAEIYLSQPGIGQVVGARVLGEFGDDPHRYPHVKTRKNYGGTSPITIASGKRKTVHARWVHNNRLIDALHCQAQGALTASPGARTYYDQQRARGLDHAAALRQLANRLVGILHGCLKTRTLYDEHTAWHHHQQDQQPAA
jgi:transposase